MSLLLKMLMAEHKGHLDRLRVEICGSSLCCSRGACILSRLWTTAFHKKWLLQCGALGIMQPNGGLSRMRSRPRTFDELHKKPVHPADKRKVLTMGIQPRATRQNGFSFTKGQRDGKPEHVLNSTCFLHGGVSKFSIPFVRELKCIPVFAHFLWSLLCLSNWCLFLCAKQKSAEKRWLNHVSNPCGLVMKNVGLVSSKGKKLKEKRKLLIWEFSFSIAYVFLRKTGLCHFIVFMFHLHFHPNHPTWNIGLLERFLHFLKLLSVLTATMLFSVLADACMLWIQNCILSVRHKWTLPFSTVHCVHNLFNVWNFGWLSAFQLLVSSSDFNDSQS